MDYSRNSRHNILNNIKDFITDKLHKKRLPTPRINTQKEKAKISKKAVFLAGIVVGSGAMHIAGELKKNDETKIKEPNSISTNSSLDNSSNSESLENENEDENKLVTYKVISPYGLNLRGTPTTKEDNKIAIVNTGDFVYADPETIAQGEDGYLWGEIDYYPTEGTEAIHGYIALNNNLVSLYTPQEQISREELYGYEKIEITDEDISKLYNFICSWENQALYSYLQGVPGYTINSPYVKNFITEDRKYYICQGDGIANGAKNYGFGCMVNQYNQPNQQTCEYFNELENRDYDITDPKYLQVGISAIPVADVNEVTRKYIKSAIEDIQLCLKTRNIKFSKSEILALASICYQFGRDSSFIYNFIDQYVEYGGNTDALKENFHTYRGTYIFKLVAGGDTYYNNRKISRADSYWNAFHSGDFIMGSGKTPVITFEQENNGRNMLEEENER